MKRRKLSPLKICILNFEAKSPKLEEAGANNNERILQLFAGFWVNAGHPLLKYPYQGVKRGCGRLDFGGCFFVSIRDFLFVSLTEWQIH